jgi:hypothetical protein
MGDKENNFRNYSYHVGVVAYIYMGRCLGLSELPTKYWPLAMGMCIVNALIAMLLMRFIA